MGCRGDARDGGRSAAADTALDAADIDRADAASRDAADTLPDAAVVLPGARAGWAADAARPSSQASFQKTGANRDTDATPGCPAALTGEALPVEPALAPPLAAAAARRAVAVAAAGLSGASAPAPPPGGEYLGARTVRDHHLASPRVLAVRPPRRQPLGRRVRARSPHSDPRPPVLQVPRTRAPAQAPSRQPEAAVGPYQWAPGRRWAIRTSPLPLTTAGRTRRSALLRVVRAAAES